MSLIINLEIWFAQSLRVSRIWIKEIPIRKNKLWKNLEAPDSYGKSSNGQFDAKRDALTGVWGLSADPENSSGKMEFRRIPPRYLAVYPSIKELSDNNPRLKSRALWGFAIAAVRNDVRRERWSWSYFSQRRKDRVAVISLGIRYWHFGTPVNHEDQPCTAAAQRLTPADACFYFSKINRTAAYAQLHV
jgi:hypothetical protein